MMTPLKFASVCYLVLLIAVASARAQNEQSPPYEPQLLRLAEIMGSLHFLTLLCQPKEGNVWFQKIEKVIQSEGKTALRKAKLVERFNSGFDSFQATYRKCTPSANTAYDRYVREAQIIVRNLTSDFSG